MTDSTRLRVRMRSSASPLSVSLTLPLVFERSFATQPATATSHWAITLVEISPRAVTTSIFLTEVLLGKPIPFVSASKERRERHSSLALAGGPLRARLLL